MNSTIENRKEMLYLTFTSFDVYILWANGPNWGGKLYDPVLGKPNLTLLVTPAYQESPYSETGTPKNLDH